MGKRGRRKGYVAPPRDGGRWTFDIADAIGFGWVSDRYGRIDLKSAFVLWASVAQLSVLPAAALWLMTQSGNDRLQWALAVGAVLPAWSLTVWLVLRLMASRWRGPRHVTRRDELVGVIAGAVIWIPLGLLLPLG